MAGDFGNNTFKGYAEVGMGFGVTGFNEFLDLIGVANPGIYEASGRKPVGPGAEFPAISRR